MSTDENKEATESHSVPIGTSCLSIDLAFVKSRLGVFEAVAIVSFYIFYTFICSLLFSSVTHTEDYGSTKLYTKVTLLMNFKHQTLK